MYFFLCLGSGRSRSARGQRDEETNPARRIFFGRETTRIPFVAGGVIKENAATMGVLCSDIGRIFIIHGDEDKVVPLKENSQKFFENYQTAGAEDSVTLLVVKGQGHNFWEGFFRCQALIDFVIERAKAGALGRK